VRGWPRMKGMMIVRRHLRSELSTPAAETALLTLGSNKALDGSSMDTLPRLNYMPVCVLQYCNGNHDEKYRIGPECRSQLPWKPSVPFRADSVFCHSGTGSQHTSIFLSFDLFSFKYSTVKAFTVVPDCQCFLFKL
jgi:hypothetical protein